MYLEYDWTFDVYRPRFGDRFTDIRGVTFYDTLKQAREHLAACRLALGRKTDTRTWKIVSAEDV